MKCESVTKRSVGTVNKIYLFVVIYALFAFSRIKYIAMPKINNISTNNMILICALVFIFLALFVKKIKNNYSVFQGLIISFLIIWAVLVCFMYETNFEQSAYALLVMFIPLLFLVRTWNQTEEEFEKMLICLNILAFIYSILTIVAALNYSFLMSLLGNEGIYGDHTRASLPLGSSISVSYYLNLSLPIALYLFSKAETKRLRMLRICVVVVNILATAIQLSRSAVVTTVIIMLVFFLFVRSKTIAMNKVSLLVVAAIGVVFVMDKLDLSRLTIGFFGEASSFDSSRLNAFSLGAHLFKEKFITGTGVGAYFYRAWTGDNALIVDGVIGLIDPHCAYIMLLSELGIVGTALYVLFFVNVFKKLTKITDPLVRSTAYLMILSLLINSIGGSQLLNECSFSAVACIYLSIFVNRSGLDIQRRENEPLN